MAKMEPSEILSLIKAALADRDPSQVPCSELVDAFPHNPQIRKMIDACRDRMADALLMGLEQVARNKAYHSRRSVEKGSLPDMGDTRFLFPTPGESND